MAIQLLELRILVASQPFQALQVDRKDNSVGTYKVKVTSILFQDCSLALSLTADLDEENKRQQAMRQLCYGHSIVPQ